MVLHSEAQVREAPLALVESLRLRKVDEVG